MNLKSIGGFLAIIGLLAIGLDFVGRVPSLLMWIYNWGDMAAWGIKIALVAVGGILYFVAPETQEEEK